MREAKLRTRWTAIDEAYEEAVRLMPGRLFDPADPAFLDDFRATAAAVRGRRRVNGLAQTLLKLTAPGVPDIYKGTESGTSASSIRTTAGPSTSMRGRSRSSAACRGRAASARWLRRRQTPLVAAVPKARSEKASSLPRAPICPPPSRAGRSEHLLAFRRRHLGSEDSLVVPRLVLGSSTGCTAFF